MDERDKFYSTASGCLRLVIYFVIGTFILKVLLVLLYIIN